jgi:hypothetical protein
MSQRKLFLSQDPFDVLQFFRLKFCPAQCRETIVDLLGLARSDEN